MSLKRDGEGSGRVKGILKKLILSLCAGIVAGGGFTLYYILFFDLPQVDMIRNYRPPEPLKIYSSDGVLIDLVGEEIREYVPLQGMAECMTFAIVAAEDAGFFTHAGVSVKGIVRALYRNLLSMKLVEGGSTISQQLAKNLFLSSERTLSRKIKELLLTLKIEKNLSKEEILELYLNQIYFGNGVYGIKSASRLYFGKDPRELSTAECALLASLPRSPSLYNPYTEAERVMRRRNYILQRMFSSGFISKEEMTEAINTPLFLKVPQTKRRLAPYFTDYILRVLEEHLGKEGLYGMIGEIRTTLNYSFQRVTDEALRKGLESFRDRRGSIPEGCVVMISVGTGEILAMSGGSDYSKTQFNRCVQAKRTVGSAIKPFIYSTAIKAGFTQSDTLWDTPLIYTWRGKKWSPRNYDGKYRGLVTLRKSLELSLNVPTVRLLARIGVERAVEELSKFGFSVKEVDLTIALGTLSQTPLNLVSAFSTFFNGGVLVEAYGIRELKTSEGEKLSLPLPERRKLLSPEEAFIVADMLMGVVEHGTGSFASEYAGRIGGKTGTTQDYRDAWFIGCSREVCIGVWVGFDDYTPLGKGETGSRTCGPIFLEVVRNLPNSLFLPVNPPDGVEYRWIDPDTGEMEEGGERAAFLTETRPQF